MGDVFDPAAKKKKKGKRAARRKQDARAEDTPGEQKPEETTTEAVAASNDYSYEMMLNRAFELIGASKVEKKGPKIPAVEAFRVGTSKTLWANFPAMCDALHRDPQHILSFFQVELGTTASIDGNGRLVIKGRFMPKQLSNVVRKYLNEYVVCRTCGSRDTHLKKEQRLYFLHCNSPVCGSQRTVAALNKAYVHRVRRKRRI